MDDASGWEDEPAGTRRWRAPLGIGLLAAGIAVAVLAVTGVLGGDDARPTQVGKLLSSDLPPTTAASSTPATGGTDTPAGTAGPTGSPSWPDTVQARPEALGSQGQPPPSDPAGLADGAYLWSDFDGWHLWIVGGRDDDTTFEVVSDRGVTPTAVGGAPQLDEADGRFTLGRGGATEAVVGADFEVDFFTTRLVVTVTGDLPLFTGAAATPAGSPLELSYEPQG